MPFLKIIIIISSNFFLKIEFFQIFVATPVLGPAWFAIHFHSLLIRNRINQWFGKEWFTIHLPLIFDSISILIRRWIMIRGWIVIRNESKSNRIKMNQCDSFASKVNQNDSKSEIKWFAQVNHKSKKKFDSPRESKPFFIWFGESKRIDSVRVLRYATRWR